MQRSHQAAGIFSCAVQIKQTCPQEFHTGLRQAVTEGEGTGGFGRCVGRLRVQRAVCADAFTFCLRCMQVIFEAGSNTDKTAQLCEARTLRHCKRADQTVVVLWRGLVLTSLGVPGHVQHKILTLHRFGPPGGGLRKEIRNLDDTVLCPQSGDAVCAALPYHMAQPMPRMVQDPRNCTTDKSGGAGQKDMSRSLAHANFRIRSVSRTCARARLSACFIIAAFLQPRFSTTSVAQISSSSITWRTGRFDMVLSVAIVS